MRNFREFTAGAAQRESTPHGRADAQSSIRTTNTSQAWTQPGQASSLRRSPHVRPLRHADARARIVLLARPMPRPYTRVMVISIIRSRLLRRLAAPAALLLGLLLHAQVLYACGLMETAPSQACCCLDDMQTDCNAGGGCDMPTAAPATSCCEISIEVPAADLHMVQAEDSSAVKSLHAPQPPPDFSSLSDLLPTPVRIVPAPLLAHTPPGSRLPPYLATLRLRI